MNAHTPGPWRVNGKQSIRGEHGEYIARANWRNGEVNAILISAAPDLYRELLLVVDTEEQSCFEQWLFRSEPSGDCDSVHAQWIESSDYQDFCELWRGPISAIAKARGES